jgi:hypothetical protein
MVLLVVSAMQINMFPAVDASLSPTCVTKPHPAEGVAKVTAALFDVVPPVPELAVVLPALCVPAQLARPAVTAARAYEPPDTSVPRAESLQALVYSST